MREQVRGVWHQAGARGGSHHSAAEDQRKPGHEQKRGRKGQAGVWLPPAPGLQGPRAFLLEVTGLPWSGHSTDVPEHGIPLCEPARHPHVSAPELALTGEPRVTTRRGLCLPGDLSIREAGTHARGGGRSRRDECVWKRDGRSRRDTVKAEGG